MTESIPVPVLAPTPAPLPAPAPSRADNSPIAVAVVALALVLVVATVIFLWLPVAPQPPLPIELYFPVGQGASFTYRLTAPDGTITYRSRNLTRQPLNLVIKDSTLDEFSAALAATNITLDPDHIGEGLAKLEPYQVVKINDVEYDAHGATKNSSQVLTLITADRLDQFGLNGVGITPPIPFFPQGSGPQTIIGNLNETTPFTVTLQTLTHGAQNTGIGSFPDCIQVQNDVDVNGSKSLSQTWYCAGVGEVSDETTDANGTRRSEIVGISAGTLVRGGSPFHAPSTISAVAQNTFEQPLGLNLTQVLSYTDNTTSGSITTRVLPVENLLLYGTQSGALVALDRAGEKQAWRFQAGDAIFGTPVVANGIVYFASVDRKVYAVRLDDGGFVWAFPMKDIVSSSPTVAGDNVYIASEDRTVYALDVDTGLPRWSFTSSGPFIAQPVVHDGLVFVSNNGGDIYALDAATGAEVWTYSLPTGIITPAVVADGKVYFGAFSRNLYAGDHNVVALDEKTGDVIWTRELQDDVLAPMVLANNRLLVTLPRDLVALDAQTGNVLWRYASDRQFVGAPLAFGSQLVVLRAGGMQVLDAATGTVVNQIPTTDTQSDTGLSSDGRELYLGTNMAEILGFSGAGQ